MSRYYLWENLTLCRGNIVQLISKSEQESDNTKREETSVFDSIRSTEIAIPLKAIPVTVNIAAKIPKNKEPSFSVS